MIVKSEGIRNTHRIRVFRFWRLARVTRNPLFNTQKVRSFCSIGAKTAKEFAQLLERHIPQKKLQIFQTLVLLFSTMLLKLLELNQSDLERRNGVLKPKVRVWRTGHTPFRYWEIDIETPVVPIQIAKYLFCVSPAHVDSYDNFHHYEINWIGCWSKCPLKLDQAADLF